MVCSIGDPVRRFKSWLLIPAVGLLAAPVAGQQRLWVQQFGTSANDLIRRVAADGSGGVYLAGSTDGSLGGPNAGFEDAWLARYDSAGARVWIRQFGTSGEDVATGLVADGSGGVFIAGRTTGSLGGPAGGGYDAWLARYDADGNQRWIVQFGTNAGEQSTDLAFDGAGGVFLTWVVCCSGSAVGVYDAWVAHYDGAGNQFWVDHFGSPGLDQASAVASDGAGGCFVAGFTSGNLGGPNAGTWDAWLARYDTVGRQQWIRQLGTSADDQALGLAPASDGGVFIAGYTNGNLGGPNAGGADAWVASYDSAGTQLWIRQFGSSSGDGVFGIAPDGSGGSIVFGSTLGSLGGPPAGGGDVWLARHDAGGVQAWITQFGSASDDSPSGLIADSAGGFMVGGSTSGSLGSPSAGMDDGWIARYGAFCYPNCDGSTTQPALNVNDFTCFLDRFAGGDTRANCDGSTTAPVLNIQDFICFLNAFAAGCS